MHRSSNLRLSTATSSIKPRQLAHLHSQMAQLQAHLSDLENHLRVTAIQADSIKRLGALQASLFMAAGAQYAAQASATQEAKAD